MGRHTSESGNVLHSDPTARDSDPVGLARVRSDFSRLHFYRIPRTLMLVVLRPQFNSVFHNVYIYQSIESDALNIYNLNVLIIPQ